MTSSNWVLWSGKVKFQLFRYQAIFTINPAQIKSNSFFFNGQTLSKFISASDFYNPLGQRPQILTSKGLETNWFNQSTFWLSTQTFIPAKSMRIFL